MNIRQYTNKYLELRLHAKKNWHVGLHAMLLAIMPATLSMVGVSGMI